jgi:hemolysin activation/secretion protein
MKLHANRFQWRTSALLLALAGPGPWARAVPAAEAAPAAPAAATAAAPEQAFDVLEYRVLGNTVLAPREIEGRLYPLLGTHKILKDVESARKALEDLYHERGYGTAFVDIPPQTVQGGVVRLHVTEGTLESRKVAGARYFAERDVVAQLPAATPGNVLQLSKLQEELTAVNRQTPDRQVVPVLKAGSAPGTVDLALTVNDTLPLHGSLELNNQATLDTHELRGVASLSYDDLFGRLDSLALQYQFTPQAFDQVRVFAVDYAMHPFASGLQPSFSYINSNSNVPTAGTLGVLGIGEITSAKLAYPVHASAEEQQSVSLGIDYKHFRNTISQNATTALETPVTYVNLSAGYALSAHTDWQVTTFTLTANGGVRHLAGTSLDFANDRYRGHPNYFDVRFDFTNTWRLPAGFGLRLRAAGQGATEPLIANEDYSLAGIDGVRGYLEAEELVDAGLKGTVQLISPPWRHGDWTLGDVYTFYDVGHGWVLDALSEQSVIELRSVGLGLDVLPGQKVTGSVSWAHVFDTASATHAGDSRVLFLMRGSF